MTRPTLLTKAMNSWISLMGEGELGEKRTSVTDEGRGPAREYNHAGPPGPIMSPKARIT